MNRAEKRRQEKLAGKTAKKAKLAQSGSDSSGQQPLTIGQSLELAVGHHTAGRLPEAESLYQQILQADPEQPVALHLLGVIAYQVGKNDIAVELITKALAIKPDYAEAHNNLGSALKELQRLEEAIVSHRRAIAIKPDYTEAHNNIGNALIDLQRPEEAVASYHKAITIKPDYAEAHSNLGNTLKELGKLDEAVASHHKAIAINSDSAKFHYNLGITLKKMGNLNDAVASYHKALSINPNIAEAHYNLGNTLNELGKSDEAFDSYHRALAIKPDYIEAHSSLIFVQDFIAGLDQTEQQAERQRWNEKFILPLADTRAHTNNRDPDRPLRIGYVSADFCHHSAQLGFGPLIMDHDRQNFDVICYDATLATDDVSKTLRTAATQWRAIKDISDVDLADVIRDDSIDILVDLSGHTRGNRLTIFGHKPAPLQVCGIGHLAPGLSTIDYRLTTDRITPVDEESIYPEKPIYLDTYFGFTPPTNAPPVGPPPCLKNGFITFGFLGRFIKTSEDVLALWARILRDVPGSRLLLKYSQLDDPVARQTIQETFSGLGITRDRLILFGETEQHEHLEAHNNVDIVLDTFPHGGGITTMDSLWMGVPVIGLLNPGKAGGRVIDCICRPVGLENWVARSSEEYHAIALERAGCPKELAETRRELRQRVCDVYSRFPRDVEESYRLIWRRWCNDEAPSPLYPLS